MAIPSLLDHIKYRYSIVITNTTTGDIIDVSKSFENAVWTTYRHSSQSGVLEVTIKEGIHLTDTVIHEGSFINFFVNGEGYFHGRIEEVELINNGEQGYVWRVKAYNSLWLLSMVENAKREHGMTASDFFQYLMDKYSHRGLQGVVREAASIPLDREYYMGESLFNMIDDSLVATHSQTADELFMIRDNMGVLEFREMKALQTPYVLGDGSFTTSYAYTANINTDTYNVIKGVRFNDDTGYVDTWWDTDTGTIDRWGWRQHIIEIQDHILDEEIETYLELVLEAKNRPVRNARITAVGIADPNMQAGAGIQVRINRKQIDHMLFAETVTHVFSANDHVMDLEISVVVPVVGEV